MFRPAYYIIGLVLLALPSVASAQTLSSADRALFENKIRPILVKYCYECHSSDSKELGGKLRLDHREGWQKGGESGPALITGKPEESLIVQALRHDGLEMPPDKPLPATVIHDFQVWIQRGAPDPRTESMKPEATADPVKSLWSLKPIRNPAPPSVRDQAWGRDAIDRFILAQLEQAQLKPTSDATARALIRRLSFDLTGLPPAFEEVEAFAAAHRANPRAAVEELVDRFLARPQFGERWGRHWLDVARFAESNGNDGLGRNPSFPHAWRYRDYVIEAMNRDTPYDEFLREQIAGDLLPAESDEQRDRNLVATGFLALAAKPAKAMNTNFDMDVVADQIDVIGRGVMGLSVACARCHDHKFDPIPTVDYYALAGIFTSTETMWGVAANEKLTATPTDLHVLKAAPKSLPPEDFVETVILRESATGKPKKLPKPKWAAGTPLAMGARDRKKPADCKVNVKGDAKKLGAVAPRGFLSACQFPDAESAPKVNPKQSGRMQLAEWLTHPQHPLTARVMVNRIWRHLFGAGLVRTPDDFGVYGEPPTHPQLLDHLATRFVKEGWSVKQLIRAIVLSRTYQLSSKADKSLVDADSENRLLARHSRRRLDAESLRDAMLHASGQLDLRPGEGSLVRHRDILVNLAGNLHQPTNRRSVYLCYLRSSPPPELAAFDLPSFVAVTGKRNVSTVPGQALYLFNNPFVRSQAAAFANRIQNETADRQGRIQWAYRAALQRNASDAELDRAEAFLLESESSISEPECWQDFCQALLAANEFRYVD